MGADMGADMWGGNWRGKGNVEVDVLDAVILSEISRFLVH